MPILKQSPVTQSKKRPRIDRDMISAPLGDFRHTMHVGRGGDAFGDTSFLSNHGGPKPNGLPTATDGLAQAELPQLPAGVPGSPTPSGGSCLDGGGIALPSPPGSLDGELCYGESLFSFELDLGPSILEEVLGVMDKGERPHEDSRGARSVGGEGLSRSSPNPRQGEEELEEKEEEAGSGHGYSFDDELDDEIGL